MARAKKVPLHPWETGGTGGPLSKNDWYARVCFSLLSHPAVKALSHLEARVYQAMLVRAAGKIEFTFPQAVYEKDYGLSKTSVQKAIKGLTAAGFIEVKKRNWKIRKPNVYRFTNGWKTRKEPP